MCLPCKRTGQKLLTADVGDHELRSVAVDFVAGTGFWPGDVHTKTAKIIFHTQRFTLEMKLRRGRSGARPVGASNKFHRSFENIKPQARWTRDKAKCLDKLSLLSLTNCSESAYIFLFTISQSSPTHFKIKYNTSERIP